MNGERLLLWPEMISCNRKPPSSWPGNGLCHRGFSEDGVIHDELCTVTGSKPVLSGQLHAKTWAEQCLHCNLEIYDNHHGVFLWITAEESSVTYSTTLSQAAVSALGLLVQMGKEGGQKQLHFIHVTAASRTKNIFILQAPLVSAYFGGPLVSEDRTVAERHQMTVDCYTRGWEETHNCYGPAPPKIKSFPKALCKHKTTIETITRKITFTVRCH